MLPLSRFLAVWPPLTMVTKIASAKNGSYNPDEARPPTGRELWRRWQFVYTGTARVPCWILRVPKDKIWEHGGLWSDNSAAMLAALVRIEFPLRAAGNVAPPPLLRAPKVPVLQ